MRCEFIAIGTELLLGQIVNSNAAWLGEQLALAGIDCLYQVTIGDNRQRMKDTITQALERSDAVIVSGGLGPTQDDITREVIAEVMDVDLIRDDEIAEKIRYRFESRGRVMSDNNLRQADIPKGGMPIPQMPGTAPGLICPLGDKVIYAVPGVPFEMKMMVNECILPDMKKTSWSAEKYLKLGKKLKNSELNRISIEEFKKSKKIPITILLENIRSAHNIGSVFRTADSFLINEIILCGISAQPPNKDIRKTALGSSESVEWKYEKNIDVAIQKLKDEGNKIISIEQTTNSISLENFKPSNNSKYAIIFGNEVNGIEQRTIDLSDMAIEIPQYGTKHSLNISVAAGIIIWNIFSKINH